MGLALPQRLTSGAPQRRLRSRLRPPLPRLSVVIVNYHQWDSTAALVRQLLPSQTMRRRHGEVFIVDNNSPAHPQMRKLRRCHGVSLRRWGRNRGFAQAVNEGCRLTQGQWILLLNPDMSLPDGFLDRAAQMAEQASLRQPRMGIIGLGLRNADGSRQLSAGPFPRFCSSFLRLLLPRSRRKYHTSLHAADSDAGASVDGAFGSRSRPRRVDWVTGCCLLIRRDCLQEVGGLDPEFFLYYEDVDLCRRAQMHGWTVWYMPDVEAVHHRPLHLRPVSPALRLVTRHSLLTYARKHWPRWQSFLLAAAVRFEAGIRCRWAGWRRQKRTVRLLAVLRQIAADIMLGNDIAARRRLRRVVQKCRFYDQSPACLGG